MITKYCKDWKVISFITDDVAYVENLIRDNITEDEKATNININFDGKTIIVTFTAEIF